MRPLQASPASSWSPLQATMWNPRPRPAPMGPTTTPVQRASLRPTPTSPSAPAGRTSSLTTATTAPRIDIAAPGGARKFNLPVWDRGGTPGYPVTTESYDAWQEFSITSNWTQEMTCYHYDITGTFQANQCYTTIQGTSMATPHVSAAIALLASYNPTLKGDPRNSSRPSRKGRGKWREATRPRP